MHRPLLSSESSASVSIPTATTATYIHHRRHYGRLPSPSSLCDESVGFVGVVLHALVCGSALLTAYLCCVPYATVGIVQHIPRRSVPEGIANIRIAILSLFDQHQTKQQHLSWVDGAYHGVRFDVLSTAAVRPVSMVLAWVASWLTGNLVRKFGAPFSSRRWSASRDDVDDRSTIATTSKRSADLRAGNA